jgi:hypothetical protein
MTRTTLTSRYRNTASAFAVAMPLHGCGLVPGVLRAEQVMPLDPSGTTLVSAQVAQT